MAALAARPYVGEEAWGAFARTLVLAAAALLGLGILFLLAVDPYDSGRTGLIRRHGLHDQFPYTANASRARDPRFDAAIFGNSHIQALRPERLDRETGAAFVSLIMPATYTQNILDVLHWYLAAHPGTPRAIVIGLDEDWCLPAMKTNDIRFPHWLYAPGFLRYAAGLVRWRSLEAAQARIAFLVTGKRGLRPDGYWDYAPHYAERGLDAKEPSYAKLAEEKSFPDNPARAYPALDRLRAELARVPPETAVALVRTPAYRTALPKPGSSDEALLEVCTARIREVVAARPRTAFLDLFRPGPDTDARDNFYDHTHYRDPLAMEVERAVARTLKGIGLARAAGS